MPAPLRQFGLAIMQIALPLLQYEGFVHLTVLHEVLSFDLPGRFHHVSVWSTCRMAWAFYARHPCRREYWWDIFRNNSHSRMSACSMKSPSYVSTVSYCFDHAGIGRCSLWTFLEAAISSSCLQHPRLPVHQALCSPI
jgi:hypothetical protein